MRGRRDGERDDHRAALSTLVAVSTLGWILRVSGAVLAALVIYLIGAGTLRKFKIAPDAEIDPEDVVAIERRYRCIVCGAEVTMTAANAAEAGEPDAPRHCREDMAEI